METPFQLDSGRGEQVQIAKCSVSKRRSFGFYQNKCCEFPYLCRTIGPFPSTLDSTGKSSSAPGSMCHLLGRRRAFWRTEVGLAKSDKHLLSEDFCVLSPALGVFPALCHSKDPSTLPHWQGTVAPFPWFRDAHFLTC